MRYASESLKEEVNDMFLANENGNRDVDSNCIEACGWRVKQISANEKVYDRA